MNEATLEVVEAQAQSMSVERIAEELSKSDISQVRERVEDVIQDKGCPDCGNDLLFTSDNTIYCPVGCFEHEI